MKRNRPAGLDSLFRPRSVAVIGASHEKDSVGYGVLNSLVRGSVYSSGTGRRFAGKVYAVNPHAKRVLGKACYPDISRVPRGVDLGVICVPAQIVPKVASDCGRMGVKSLAVLSAGFGEAGAAGKALETDLVKVCMKYGMRLLGPNCLGVMRPHEGLNASFALRSPLPGNVAFVTQSGALADSVIDWSLEQDYGFSTIVSLGNCSDVGASEVLDWLARDKYTKAVALYLEGLADGRKFARAARRLAKRKPVLVVKGGRTTQGVSAATSHTGALAGDYRVFEGAMRQAGVVLCESMEELFDLSKAVYQQPKLKRNSVAIVTNGGGAGVLAADYCAQYGLRLAPLRRSTILKLDRTGAMHPAYSRKNPLDLIGDAGPARYDAAISVLLSEPYISGLIVVQTVQTMTDSAADARVIARAHLLNPSKPVVCAFMGGKYSRQGVRVLKDNGIPDFNDPRKAVQAMAALGGLL